MKKNAWMAKFSALFSISYVTLDKWVYFSEPQFHICKMGINIFAGLIGLLGQ